MTSTGDSVGGQVLSALSPSDIHVLLVDDERLTRLVVGNLLRTCKYKVTIAESGTQALDVLSKAGPGSFQLILTDVMMPDVGGLELLRFVRSHQHLYNVPVVMMSASEAQETMCAALLGSADEYLVKPVTRKEVQNIWMHVMRRYHHAAAVQPALTPEAPQDPTPSSAVALTTTQAVVGTAAGYSGGAVGSLIPLASPAGTFAAGLPSGGNLSGTVAQAALDRGPLLSLGPRGSLGLSTEVAHDMLRAAALAASTKATHGAGPATGSAGPVGGHRLALQSGVMSSEDRQALATLVLEMDPPTAHGSREERNVAFAKGVGPEPAAHDAVAVVETQGQVDTLQQRAPSQQLQNSRGSCPGHAAGRPSVHGSGGGHGASKVNLLKWLRRSNRCLQPKESFWIFCKVLILLDSCQSAAGSRACGLRPSKLVLYSNGRVAFATPPLSSSPSAAAAAAGAGGADKGGDDSAGGCADGRKKRRRHSPSQLRGAEEEHAPSAMALNGVGCQVARGPAPAQGSSALPPVMLPSTTAPQSAAAAAAAGVGSVAAALTAIPAGSSDDDEDVLYCSPEETMGQPATPASDMFSLGLLFFELFYVCPSEERAALLRDARQRVLPPSFGRQQPKEAAFVLALLHPDPACRPTLEELLGSAMFRATCASLRPKSQRTGATPTTVGGPVTSGREHSHPHRHHHHHHNRYTNHNRQASESQRGTAVAVVLNGGGRPKQMQHPLAHRLAKGSSGGGVRGAAAAQDTSGTPVKPPAEAKAASSVLPHYDLRGSMSASGAPLRADDAVLLEFLHILRKRKMEELAQIDADLAFFTSGAHMVEQYLMYLHQTRSAKRQRGGGGGGGSGGAVTGSVTASGTAPNALVASWAPCVVASSETSSAMHPPSPPLPQSVLKADGSEAGASAMPAGLGEKSTDHAAGAGPNGEDAQLLAANGSASRALPFPHSATWSEHHQAAQSKWCRVSHKYEQLEPVFLERCRSPPGPSQAQKVPLEPTSAMTVARRHADAGGLPEPLLRFAEDLAAFATFTTLTPVVSLQYTDPPSPSSMVAGAAFDRDDEFFALAGVNKRIKIFEREAVLQSNIGTHYPVLEISSRSRLSSVTWSSYIKGHLASADYEGVVQLWDANTNSELMQFEEHRKRVWSIDFSQADPARLLSGGDDGLVKLWSIQQETSTATIELNANVCSVQFSPISPHIFAAGCANSRIFLYDIRNTASPISVLPGHTRAVSYVRFLSPTRLVSASTDNTLRLWHLDGLGTTSGSAAAAPEAQAGGSRDAAAASCVQVFRGHVNERNFTGLSVSPDGYISCGSENNRVFCYYQSLPMPVASFDFSAPDADAHGGSGAGAAAGVGGAEGRAGTAGGGDAVGPVAGSSGGGTPRSGPRSGTGQFVSSVCWSRRSNLLLAANSVGLIKLFTLH